MNFLGSCQCQWEPILMEMFLLWYNVQSFLSVHAFDMGSSRSLPPSLVASSSSVSTPVSGLTATMVAPAPACGAGGSAAMKQDTRVENTDFNHDLFGSYKTSTSKSKTFVTRSKAAPYLHSLSQRQCCCSHVPGLAHQGCLQQELPLGRRSCQVHYGQISAYGHMVP